MNLILKIFYSYICYRSYRKYPASKKQTGLLQTQTDVIKIICYKNQEPLIFAMNPEMRLTGCSDNFIGFEIVWKVIGSR